MVAKFLNSKSRGLLTGTLLLALATLAGPALGYAGTRSFPIAAEAKRVSIGSGMTYAAWTYGGTVPGPLMRVTEGDTVNIQLVNHTASAHGLEVFAA